MTSWHPACNKFIQKASCGCDIQSYLYISLDIPMLVIIDKQKFNIETTKAIFNVLGSFSKIKIYLQYMTL